MQTIRVIGVILVVLLCGSVYAAAEDAETIKKDFGYVDKDEVGAGKEAASEGIGGTFENIIYWARVNNVIYYVAGFIALLVLRGILNKRKQKKRSRIYT